MPDPRLVRAWLESPTLGIVEFDRNWDGPAPPLRFGPAPLKVAGLAPAPKSISARAFGYYIRESGEPAFVLALRHGCDIDPARDRVFLAGDFNAWNPGGADEWRLEPAELEGEDVLAWTGPAAKIAWPARQHFKFVTSESIWLAIPNDASNAVRDANGNLNRELDPSRSGRHLWSVKYSEPPNLAEPLSVALGPATEVQALPLVPGRFFYELGTDLALGAIVKGQTTVFRIFAPRARRVTLRLCDDLALQDKALAYELALRPGPQSGVWEVALDQSLHGWFYWYSIDGVRSGRGGFDPGMRVLDPYALACIDRDGPGIVLDRAWIGRGDRGHKTPAWHDLVIAEAHVRDLAANAPVQATPEERLGFEGLRRWVESPEFHLHHLGVNCVELQPVQEFDNRTREEYHWGYMPNNYFSPESSYSLNPAEASGVRELQQLVAAFHRRGMAVLLDVVYNHSGEPAHFFFLDRLYYFEQDTAGNLSNWSGCGNDLRAGAAMVRRLIIDSCTHLIEAYGVDGFRFDLAELLGVDVLVEVEAALKKVKPDVILIAEPWSFRGNIAGSLRDTGWASWNDGFRDFVRDYVRGRGAAERLEYFLRGSPWYFAKWPAQTVNYTESHDDRTWIDSITENPGGDGSAPAGVDRRRTHLMAAILFMSVGIPMIAAGQDFLRSKHGVNNTYQRGDLNALDYRRLYRYLGTHTYFADWIAFRRGETGRLLRHYSRASEGFFDFYRSVGGPALAAVYNADRSFGPERLLFAVNPASNDATIPVGETIAGSGRWRQLADHERFYTSASHGVHPPVEPELYLPPFGCGLWLSR